MKIARFWDPVENAARYGVVEGDVVFDTRTDPVLARNAVYGRASWEHLRFGDGPLQAAAQPGGYTGYQGSANRNTLEARGYLGLVKQAVLEGRVLREDSDRPLPPYLQPQLGGLSTLRGFRTGSFVGDTVVAMSAEVVLPLTSPLKLGRRSSRDTCRRTARANAWSRKDARRGSACQRTRR